MGFERLPKLLDTLVMGRVTLNQTGLCCDVYLLDMGIARFVTVVGDTNLRRRM